MILEIGCSADGCLRTAGFSPEKDPAELFGDFLVFVKKLIEADTWPWLAYARPAIVVV